MSDLEKEVVTDVEVKEDSQPKVESNDTPAKELTDEDKVEIR